MTAWTAWTDHVARWKDCRLCPLCDQRANIVLARGVLPCDVCFVGEAPGASEDALGVPFIGPAGHITDQIVERAVPPDVRCAFCNLVCCFPREAKARGENEPEHEEIMACRPRLVEFLNLAQPRLVVRVGNLSQEYCPTWPRTVDIIHPAAITRMPLAQRQMAVQKATVQLRCAVASMLQSSAKGGPQCQR